MEEAPFEVMEGYPETGDLSGQVSGDVIDAARNVRFRIEDVTPRLGKNGSGELLTAKLNVRAAIGPLGVDGDGRYVGKNLFAELITWYNEQSFTSDWWKKQARFPYKQFLTALGLDPVSPPKVNDEFLASLKGKEFTADVTKRELREDTGEVDPSGKKIYRGIGEYRNELKNFRKAE